MAQLEVLETGRFSGNKGASMVAFWLVDVFVRRLINAEDCLDLWRFVR